MRILGIDYGRKKIGLAMADTMLAEPYLVLRFSSEEEAVRKLLQVVESENVEKVVIGVSEGKMAEETREFGELLEDKLKIKVDYQDETLTTHTAQELSINAGITRKKRKEMEDAYSATIILQTYIDLQ